MATQNSGKSRGGAANLRPFKPGQSGNPGGRKKIDPEVKEMLTAACPDAVRLLVDTMQDENVKRDLRIDCANTIIERVLGKAAQPILAELHETKDDTMTLSEMMDSIRELMDA